ncbi:MAG TPA: hypothetical protein V6C72_14245 [Chroococcales cyanobacterium]
MSSDSEPAPDREAPASQSSTPAGQEPARGKEARRPILESASAAVDYIDGARKDTKVSLRDFDRRTNMLMGSALLFLIVPLFWPTIPSAWLWVGDGIFGIIILVFLSSRFGLLRTLSPRQAILVWEMIIGSAILGAFLAVNAHGLINLIRAAVK